MGRRSDHSPEELRVLLVQEGHGLMAERGFAKFSAREAARRAGYSVGTIYNVFGALDGYLIAINSQTFLDWSKWLETSLSTAPPEGEERLAVLVKAYFAFAEANSNAWMAIYDHRINRDTEVSPADQFHREALTGIVDREVSAWLGKPSDEEIRRLVRSLIATVHGHCVLWLSGSYALMQEEDPMGQAVSRAFEIVAAHKGV